MLTEPIRNKKHIKQLVNYYLNKKPNMRNYLLIVMGLYTALRISDILAMRWRDVYDFEKNEVKTHLRLTEQKTGKPKVIAVNKELAHAINLHLISRGGCDSVPDTEFLFKNNRKNNAAISRVQAWRIIKEAGDEIDGRVSCHSLRKTFGYHAWRRGEAPSVIMDIFNHSSYTITRRYLGISQDDRDKVYLAAVF